MVLVEFILHIYNSYKLESNMMYGFDGVRFTCMYITPINLNLTLCMFLMEFSLHEYNSYKLESNIMYGFDGVRFTCI